MQLRSFAFVAGLSVAFVAPNAEAHSLLMNPPPVINDDNAKSGPCGCYFGAGPEDPTEDASPTACPAGYMTTSLVAGSKLQVTWKETVNHNGKFRVALSTKPINLAKRADLDANVLYEAADTNSVSGGLVSTTITVPNTPCTNCVLQLRQLMDAASTPYYYSCAAIDITSAGSGSSSSSGSGSSSSSSGGVGGMGGSSGVGGNENVIGAGPAPIDAPEVSGACSVRASDVGSSSSLWMTLAGLFVLTLRRRSPAPN
jgi:MYXO-CTERM domain-containing protein